MYSHIMVGTNDLDRSKKFYDAVLGTLGVPPGAVNEDRRVFYMTPAPESPASLRRRARPPREWKTRSGW